MSEETIRRQSQLSVSLFINMVSTDYMEVNKMFQLPTEFLP